MSESRQQQWPQGQGIPLSGTGGRSPGTYLLGDKNDRRKGGCLCFGDGRIQPLRTSAENGPSETLLLGPGGDSSRDQARAEEGLSELGCRDTLMVGTGKTARVATPRVRQPYPPSMGAPQQHQTPFQMFPLLQASLPWMQRPSFS